MKLLFFLILTVSICGCSHSKPRPVTYRNVGHLINVVEFSHVFFGEPTSKVTTEKGTFTVFGVVPVVMPGEPVSISSDGYLCVHGNRPLELWNW